MKPQIGVGEDAYRVLVDENFLGRTTHKPGVTLFDVLPEVTHTVGPIAEGGYCVGPVFDAVAFKRTCAHAETVDEAFRILERFAQVSA